jgi:hypothetical protein
LQSLSCLFRALALSTLDLTLHRAAPSWRAFAENRCGRWRAFRHASLGNEFPDFVFIIGHHVLHFSPSRGALLPKLKNSSTCHATGERAGE